jgi:hypothetical protein
MRTLQAMVLGLGLLVAMTLGTTAVAQDTLPVEIVPPGEEFGGATAAEWEARWWQWAISIPAEFNPNFDATGGSCGIGQFGPVFLLPGIFSEVPDDVEFTCTVPEGVGIYVGIGGVGCSSVEPPPYFGGDEDELAACATGEANSMLSSEVTINGVAVDDPMQYRHVTPLYTLNFGPGNFYELDPIVALSVTDAWGFVIAPPAPGEYELVISNQWDGMDEPYVTTYTIVVTPATVIDPLASPVASPMT